MKKRSLISEKQKQELKNLRAFVESNPELKFLEYAWFYNRLKIKSMSNFFNGFATAERWNNKLKDYKVGVINQDGDVVLDFQYDSFAHLEHTNVSGEFILSVEIDGQLESINQLGEIVTKSKSHKSVMLA
jgi:hypothetical protein